MIHTYKLAGYSIVLDPASGSIHSVDEVAFDVIEMMAQGVPEDDIIRRALAEYAHMPDVTEAEVREILADAEQLRRDGKLFSEDTYAGQSEQLKRKNTELKALCLHVSHECNMSCDYCFAGKGRFSGPAGLMSADTARRAIDFLIKSSGNRRNLEVDFFGGEPLLNWDVVKETVRYARSIEAEHGKNFRFTLTTNGLLIDDDVIDFSCSEMTNVVLSLDGRRQTHDRLRILPGGGGSYDDVLPKFKRLIDARGGRGYYMRGTFTRHNTDFASDVLHMADLGFTELSMEPVVALPDSPNALSAEHLPELMREYERLAMEMLRREREGRGFTFYHYMIDLTGGPCIYRRVSGCGSGCEYLAVTPSGELYPCHQFVGNEAFRMGDLDSGVTNGAVRGQFMSLSAYARPECRDCWARLYCSGGCAANSYNATGSVTGVYGLGCELFKKRVECAVMMKVAGAEGIVY